MNFIPIDFVDSVIQTNSRKECYMSCWKDLSGTFKERSEHLADNQIFVNLRKGGFYPNLTYKSTVTGRLNGEPIKNMSIDDALQMEKFLVRLEFEEFWERPEENKNLASHTALFQKAVSICSKFPEIHFSEAFSQCRTLQDANVFLTKLSFSPRSVRNNLGNVYMDFLLLQLQNGRLDEVFTIDTDALLKSDKRDDIFRAFFESKTCKQLYLEENVVSVNLSAQLPSIFELWTTLKSFSGHKRILRNSGYFSVYKTDFESSGYNCQIDTSEAGKNVYENGRFRSIVIFKAPFKITDPKKPRISLSWFAEVRVWAHCNNIDCEQCLFYGPCDNFKWQITLISEFTGEIVFHSYNAQESHWIGDTDIYKCDDISSMKHNEDGYCEDGDEKEDEDKASSDGGDD
ncbi:hypothetical protein L596_026932 [Steinernema carpocapsae]|uniref:Uncharacterized protein n=1 Tax=Steinernema carpocapsae TaxID=34508 RepID=A0A4U5M2T6_STECR|nr:hypothetical protein L596_026932 [Steinernema carpocapsae]